ncbi:Surfeit locus protein 1 [Ancistrocladus abbreviatus]
MLEVHVKHKTSSSSTTIVIYGQAASLLNRHCALHMLPLSAATFSTSARTISSTDGSPSASSSLPQEKQKGIWSKLLLFVPGAIAFGLGTWQIFRRQDKIKMLDYRGRRLEAEPVKLNALSPSWNLDSLDFRRVACRGLFDEKRSIFVGPRSRSISGVTNNGYYVITPLMPIPGDPESVQSPVLVNRGWVPQSWREKLREVLQNDKQPMNAPSTALQGERSNWWRSWFEKPARKEDHAPRASPVELIGVARGSEKPSIFVPANDPGSGQWFYVDVPAVAHACGLPENVIYVEDINENINPSNPYPIPKDANSLIRSSVMPQDHLNYILTWYSLSAAVTFMAYKRIRAKRSHR